MDNDSFEFDGIKTFEEQTQKARESDWIDEKIDSVKGSGSGVLSEAICRRYYDNIKKRKNVIE